MSVRLSPADAWTKIAEAHTGILTTLRADGTPIALPVWFVARDHRIYVATPAKTKKLARVRRNPRVSFLVESGRHWRELVGIHCTGTARVVDDRELAASVQAALDHKYDAFRTASTLLPGATRSHYATTAIIEIVPDDRMLTWDNSRLQLGDDDCS